MRLRSICCVLVFAGYVCSVAADETVRVPILLNKPDRLNTPSWPVTCGVPFKRSEFRDVNTLGVVDEKGTPVPCQIVKRGDWEDGSLRWASVDFNARLDDSYFLTKSPRPEAKDDIKLQQSESGIELETGGARYSFSKGGGCFDSIGLDANKDGKISAEETLVSKAASAFYVIDSKGRRGVLQGTKLAVESDGKRHAVVRLEGEYRDDKGDRNAAAVIYFHFYAGCSQVRVSHKLIATEDTNQLWFRDIGLSLPVATGEAARGDARPPTALGATTTFNSDHDKPGAAFPVKLAADSDVVMMQDEFPHFGSKASHFAIVEEGKDSKKELQTGAACGDWADVSSARWGLAAQLPAFAEQFPKAFRISQSRSGVSPDSSGKSDRQDGPTLLTIKLWAQESGKELDFRTPQIMKNYFGHDWIPENDPCMKVGNTAQGTAKTHDIWLYPHLGALTPEISAGFGATREEIYAAIDPAWVARSEVMGRIHPKDTARFPEAEEVISDYFDRSVLAGNKVFPATGYLYWGMYPFSAQPWELKNGQWYPTIHRLARCLEYNLKRGMWVLYARSGERKYHDYARKYTRLCGDLLFSNSDSDAKPKGWIAMGMFHSPIVWGHYEVRPPKPGRTRNFPMDGSSMCLSFASSEDVIQFVYDYFLTGDLHSRDSTLTWKEAMIKEMNFDVDKALQFYPPSAFFRILGSAYELDHDPRLLDYGSKIMKKHIALDGKNILNPEIPTNYGKEGEVFSSFYYYYVATGDPLAKKAIIELARFRYQQGRQDMFFQRAGCLLQAFSLAYEETKDPAYAAYIAQELGDFTRTYQSLADMGVDLEKLDQKTSTPWGHVVMTRQPPINIGIPVAQEVIATHKEATPYMPVAVKPQPTQKTFLLLKKEKPGAAILDVHVNNSGDRALEPKLLDVSGRPVKLEVVERTAHQVAENESSNGNSIWYMAYEEQLFFRLKVPESVPPGVYQLDLGSEVTFTVLNSGIGKVQQVAPDGVGLRQGDRSYFHVPSQATTVEYFSTRPLRIYDPAGKPVEPEDLKNGRFRISIGGRSGAWAMEGGTDKLLGPEMTGTDTFVRMISITEGSNPASPFPLIMALGDPSRLFDVEASLFASASTALANPAPPADNPYVDRTGWGKAFQVSNQSTELALKEVLAEGPRQQGTVEFWFCPQWSVTDCHMAIPQASSVGLQLFRLDPVSLTYSVSIPDGGRTGRYNVCYLMMRVEDAGTTRARLYLEAGKWYHVALTWNVDGVNSHCTVFINGRRKGYFHYSPGMKPTVEPSKVVAAGDTLRFGSGHIGGRVATTEMYDELRVSRTVRYKGDFEPPAAPFKPDPDTYVLMHFDGSLEAAAQNTSLSGKFIRKNLLWTQDSMTPMKKKTKPAPAQPSAKSAAGKPAVGGVLQNCAATESNSNDD